MLAGRGLGETSYINPDTGEIVVVNTAAPRISGQPDYSTWNTYVAPSVSVTPTNQIVYSPGGVANPQGQYIQTNPTLVAIGSQGAPTGMQHSGYGLSPSSSTTVPGVPNYVPASALPSSWLSPTGYNAQNVKPPSSQVPGGNNIGSGNGPGSVKQNGGVPLSESIQNTFEQLGEALQEEYGGIPAWAYAAGGVAALVAFKYIGKKGR